MRGKLEVAVLDATAIGVSMARGQFATASSVMFMLGLGELMEEWTHKKSVADLASSMSLNVEKVWRRVGETDELVSIRKIVPGDHVRVEMGNMIPLDGIVVEGEAMVNQASLTGESVPVRKEQDAMVYAGTVVEEGALTLCVKQAVGETRYEKIVPAMAAAGTTQFDGGPGLMFIYLPNMFAAMPGGHMVMIVFFLAVLFAGLTSLVNLFEAPIAILQDNLHFSRAKAVVTIAVIGVVVSICIQGIVAQWMDFVSIYICPLGAGLAGIMFAWVWGKQAVEDSVSLGRSHRIGSWYYPLYKYGFCILTLAVFILGIVCGGIG